MEELIQASGGVLLGGLFVSTLLFAAIAEMVIPCRREGSSLPRRWFSNAGLGFINHFVVKATGPIAALVAAYFAANSQIGLLNQYPIGFLPSVIIAVLALDLGTYLLHVLNHNLPWLWRFHAVHHSDTEVDFTTTARSHPFEALLGVFFAVPIVVVLGLPPVTLLVYQLFSVVLNILVHCNIALPEKLDRILRLVVVTPNFHRLHHSADRAFTNSNYGSLLTWFDFAFGTSTWRPSDDHRTMALGLEYFRDRRIHAWTACC